MARKRKHRSDARTVAERLRELLAEHGITQGELARRAGVSAQVVSRLLAEGNMDMTLGIACRLCWAMGYGTEALEGVVFAEWHDAPGVAEWQIQELDRRRLQQKLEAIRGRIEGYRAYLPSSQDPGAQLARRWGEGMIGYWEKQETELAARLRELEARPAPV
jgi:transcriptional regulator with XRE-family HTH domain